MDMTKRLPQKRSEKVKISYDCGTASKTTNRSFRINMFPEKGLQAPDRQQMQTRRFSGTRPLFRSEEGFYEYYNAKNG